MNKILRTLSLFLVAGIITGFAQTDATKVDFGDPTLKEWVRPEYPAAALKNRLEGQVVVEFAVESDGHVSQAKARKSTNEIFENSAVEAVKKWTFNPAIDSGKPVAGAMGVLVPFTLKVWNQKPAPTAPPGTEFMPMGLPTTPVKVKSVPDPDYPEELDERKLPGGVEIEFTVSAEGKVLDPKVVFATHAAFVETALSALEKGQFEPAHQGPLTKAGTLRYPMSFESMGAKRPDIFAANDLTVLTDPVPDLIPGVVVLIEPVYPFSRLIAREEGSAEMEFTVDEKGSVGTPTLIAASAPEFGTAMIAAVEAWVFKPAANQGNNQAVKVKVVHKFVPPESGPLARLIPDLQPNGAGIGGASGLDQRLKPLWRGFPAYPHALMAEKPTGDAKIEFIIDRFGRVRAPRVVSASRDEFGWAAATAISQWVFERPTKKGEPVDVKVAIPVGFKPPKE